MSLVNLIASPVAIYLALFSHLLASSQLSILEVPPALDAKKDSICRGAGYVNDSARYTYLYLPHRHP